VFAYVQPYSLNDIKLSVNQFESQCKKLNLYFHRQTLTKSLEGHSLELLTVTVDGESTEADRIEDPASILYPGSTE
jgi:hypothetical protein